MLAAGTPARRGFRRPEPPRGDTAKARRYFARLVELADQGSTRPELAEARAFLSANR
jgi:hypothetical protein